MISLALHYCDINFDEENLLETRFKNNNIPQIMTDEWLIKLAFNFLMGSFQLNY